jgi:hypothetical protein
MPTSYGELWRKVRLYVPGAPALLVQDMVRTAYKTACDERHWGFLRGESEFAIGASKSGTADLTNGSVTVAGAGGSDGIAFAASDIGRQLRYGGGPPITITDVSVAGDTSATLERAWQGEPAADAEVVVCDIYATCPADFNHFISVVDPYNQRQISVFESELALAAADPSRNNTGDVWALVNYRNSALTGTLGRVQYEWWPVPTGSSVRRFPYLYHKRPADLADDDYFQGPFRDRDDIIRTGALAEAARWPGASDANRNPYFNLRLATQLEEQFRQQVAMMEVRDEETYITWWNTEHARGGRMGLAPRDSNWAQSHE